MYDDSGKMNKTKKIELQNDWTVSLLLKVLNTNIYLESFQLWRHGWREIETIANYFRSFNDAWQRFWQWRWFSFWAFSVFVDETTNIRLSFQFDASLTTFFFLCLISSLDYLVVSLGFFVYT